MIVWPNGSVYDGCGDDMCNDDEENEDVSRVRTQYRMDI